MEGVVRVALYVLLLAGLFVGAVASAGNRLGAFDPLDPPPIPTGPGDEEAERDGKRQKRDRTPERHAPARWVTRANALCAATEPELVEAGLRIVRATERQDWDALTRAWLDVVPEQKRWNRRIARLGAPAGLEATWRRLLARLAEDERGVDRIVAAVSARDAQAYAGLLASGAASDDAEDELFRRLGADRCTFEPAGAGTA